MKKITPISAIRAYCINCCGDNQKAPALCSSQDCALYAYRLGKNPARKGVGGGKGRKCNGEGIMPSRVAKTLPVQVCTQTGRREIVVSGHKRIIIEDVEEI